MSKEQLTPEKRDKINDFLKQYLFEGNPPNIIEFAEAYSQACLQVTEEKISKLYENYSKGNRPNYYSEGKNCEMFGKYILTHLKEKQ